MSTFEPASHHNTNWTSPYTNQPAQQYRLATRQEIAHRSRRRSRSPAGLPSGAGTSAYGGASRDTIKTIDTDLTRYKNTSSFRGTTPPQRLRYIFNPVGQSSEYSLSDGRLRTWEEVPFDSQHKPKPWRDENGVEWLPVLSKDATDREMEEWGRREEKRAYMLQRRERRWMKEHGGQHSNEWSDVMRNIYPSILAGRRSDGSSHLLDPSGRYPVKLLDSSQPWHSREYHHVGRDPLANYQTIFGGLEAERERQRILSLEEQESEELYLKHQRKKERDERYARRKEEKMMLKYDLELQKLNAKKQAALQAEGQTKIVKKVIHHPNGRDEVVFVKKRVATTTGNNYRSTTPTPKPNHAPWGSSIAAQRNAARTPNNNGLLSPNAQQALARLTPAEKRALGLTGDGVGSRARSASRAGARTGSWMDPATRQSSTHHARVDSPRSRSRSTSSSRSRRRRRAEKAEKVRQREESKRKREYALKHSTSIQAGSGELPTSAEHPRASEYEAFLLNQSKERRDLDLNRLSSTLNSLDKLSLGGVGRSRARHRRSPSAQSDSSARSASSHSSSGFSSSLSSRSTSRERRRSHDDRTRQHSRRRHRKHRSRSRSKSRSRSRSSSRSSYSSSSSRSRSRSRSSSSSSVHRSRRSSRHRSHKSGGPPRPKHDRDWQRRDSFEEMDSRLRSVNETKWLRDWEKRYKKATSERQRRVLKEEKKEWKERRKAQHTLVQASKQVGPNDAYLTSPSAAAAATNNTGTNVVARSTVDIATGVLTDQYGTPISQYGTIYPKPEGTLFDQARTLEAYSASLKYSDQLLEETRTSMERTVAGMENIVDGLRNGYATKGLQIDQEKAQQHALHLSLRAAIRAREDRRKKTEAMKRANRNVLDELRRQESVIMDRSADIEEGLALEAYENQVRTQQAKIQQAQLQQQLLLMQQQQQQAALNGRGRKPNINGHRPKSTTNLALGGTISGVQQYWYESADPSFTPNHIAHNQELKHNLAATGQY